jgi:hypothetical protein
MDKSTGKRRITLAQLTLELLQLEVDEIKGLEGSVPSRCSDFRSEDAVASQIALGMARHRTGQ